jgi:hypothetical protein
MDHADQLIYRVALDIYEQLRQPETLFVDIPLPEAAWQQCRQLSRRVRRAQERGWHLAAERCRRDVRTTVQRLKNELERLEPALNPLTDLAPQPSPHELARDLFALHDEFDDVTIDGKQKTVSVTTESIVLEDWFFGPFEIRLDWSDLRYGHPRNYRVIAVDPQPAASNPGVTHPHVQDESVCEGDGRQPIRAALQQGRLFDFFTLVANVLRTYNAGSPYVSLEDWDGNPCHDCGMMIDPDEWCSCCRCSVTLCCECYVRCLDCQDDYCLECLQRCACCDEYYCNYCLRACPDCRDDVCSDCLINNERCETCHEKTTTDDNQNTEGVGTATPSTDTPVQPHRVGQAAVPAGLR